MADVTAESPVSSETGSPTPTTTPQAAAAGADTSADLMEMATADVTIRDLMEAGVHFGHQTRRWNPRMKPYLFGERNGVHIVNLDITLPRLREGLDFLRDVVAGGGKVLFVSTKRQAREPIKLHAERSNQFFVNSRWLGGMLTNFKTVKKSIDRYKSMLELTADEEKTAELSKKELARVNRQIDKYRKSLDGIREMNRLPQALFIIDVNSESIAVKEAHRLSIPIVAVVDSNCDPMDIDLVIPGNDDSIRAIELYCSRVASACLEGEALYNDRVQADEAKTEKSSAKAEPAGARTGRVVVEIKHPPRRGRGAAMAAERREAEQREADAAEKVAVKPEEAVAKPEEQPAAENAAEPKEES